MVFERRIPTENSAFKLTDSVLKSINKEKKHVGRIFSDLAKAFECVNQKILLAKLHFCGNEGIRANLFRSYITNKTHKVETKSTNANQKCGVHQVHNSRAFTLYCMHK
jgi:hypothetical protein